MKEEIIRLREELVGLSSDPIKTRELLDKLADEEIFKANIESPFHVGKDDIKETKKLDVCELHRIKGGYCLHYYGGYSVLVEDKLIGTASTLEQIMEGVPVEADSEEEREAYELALTAAEQVFRLPMYVFSHPATTYNLATIGLMYQNLLQRMGSVPTAETDNPEYDKFLRQMNELLENFAAGLEKEGLEYEKRNGIENGTKEREIETEGESKGEGEQTEQEGS